MILFIDEEYGFGHWVADLSPEEYQQLLERWGTMRGLNCLVPILLIVPQARRLGEEEEFPPYSLRCHIHECDDSYLDGTDYVIPEAPNFWIDGVEYDNAAIDDAARR